MQYFITSIIEIPEASFEGFDAASGNSHFYDADGKFLFELTYPRLHYNYKQEIPPNQPWMDGYDITTEERIIWGPSLLRRLLIAEDKIKFEESLVSYEKFKQYLNSAPYIAEINLNDDRVRTLIQNKINDPDWTQDLINQVLNSSIKPTEKPPQ